MESLNLSFWLGLGLGLPLAIGGNLLTPLVKRLWAKRSSKRSAKLATELRGELAETNKLAADANKHQIFLLESVLGITFLMTLLVAMAASFYLVAALLGGSFVVSVAPLAILVGGGSMIAKECISTMRKSYRIKNVDEYRTRIEAQIKALEIRALTVEEK